MNILIKKKPSELITPESINFTELVRNSNTTLSLGHEYQSNMIKILNEEFTEQQQKWFIANLYIYMHYHPTADYPINLENVFHMIGFANKGNAKRTLENNFTKEEDYKITILPSEKGTSPEGEAGISTKNLGGAGLNKEIIMLNVDTFKSLCMLAKTDKGKEIRKYYVKLENIHNKIIKEEIEGQKLLLQKEKENTVKLLEEKDKYIAQLKEVDVQHIYIGHNPKVKNLTKFGINTKTKKTDVLNREEQHKSSNPDFEFLFTYETINAKLIEDLVKLLLKPYKYIKPEWVSISYTRMKQVVDFAIMVYDNYHIEESIDNLVEFISRYRSNRLINTNKARVHVNKNIYEEWIKENIVMIPNAKISTDLICNDFYDWYKLKYPTHFENSHLKLDTGNWSTSFQKEITNIISDITKIEYTQKLSFTDKSRGIYFPKCAGFIGFEVKSMNKKLDFFDKSVYQNYVKEFITITNNPKNKVSRKEILDDFLIWVKNNNFVTKNKIMCRTSISSVFKDVLIENIENITNLKIQDVCKLTHFGCFVGMNHSKFPFIGNESPEKELQTNSQLIKSQIDNWVKNPTTKIAKVFFKCIEQDNKISNIRVKDLMNSKFNMDLTSNKRNTNYHLIFGKETTNFFIKEDALNYYNTL
jgi:hypothetical protein